MFDQIIQDPQRFVAQAGFVVASGITGLFAGAWALPLFGLMG